MKPDIYLLIIDDDSQRKEIGEIERGLKGSHNVHSFNLRTSAPEFRIEGSNDADFEKIKIGITKLFNEVGHFHLVLTDFRLNASFDGLDVVEFLRKNWDTVPIMLYSGLISDVVKRILNTTASQLNKEQIVSAISELFNYHIVDCVSRLDYVKKAIDNLPSRCPERNRWIGQLKTLLQKDERIAELEVARRGGVDLSRPVGMPQPGGEVAVLHHAQPGVAARDAPLAHDPLARRRLKCHARRQRHRHDCHPIHNHSSLPSFLT